MENENKKVYTKVEDLIQDLVNYECVINVSSESEAKEFVRIMRDKFNIGWSDSSYNTYYDWYEENTCYDFELGANDMGYLHIGTYSNINVDIIPYSQVRDLLINNTNTQNRSIKIKYFEGATPLKTISKGNWIDVYANADIHLDFLEMKLIPLGFALDMPDNVEGLLAPRSSTFKTWGIIQTNSVGIVDSSYRGNNDEWKYPALCLRQGGTDIKKGDKIGQFRLMKSQDNIEFIAVEDLQNEDRGGFGTTGTK